MKETKTDHDILQAMQGSMAVMFQQLVAASIMDFSRIMGSAADATIESMKTKGVPDDIPEGHPRTADGKVIYLGMSVYTDNGNELCAMQIGTGFLWCIDKGRDRQMRFDLHEPSLYSTLEAAQRSNPQAKADTE